MTTYGEVSWSDDSYQGDKKNTNSKDLFLRLDPGSNEMRIITKPFQYLVHKIKKDPNDKKDFGQKAYCSAVHGSCPACDLGDKAKLRWLVGVISRKTNAYKILDISFAVYSQIKKYNNNVQRWGDPSKYDIDIVVDENGGATGYYSVQAISKEPLSAGDQLLKDKVDLDDLKRRTTPPSAENVQKRLEKILGTVPVKGEVKAEVKASKPASVSLDDDVDEVFPNYDATT